MSPKRVLIWGQPTRQAAQEVLDKVKDKYSAQNDVVFEHIPLIKTREEAVKALKDSCNGGPAHALLSFSFQAVIAKPFNRELIEPLLPHLRCVTSGGAGYEAVDVEGLAEAGVYFSNTPQAPSEPTAVLHSTLILACIRQVGLADKEIRAGKWKSISDRGKVKSARNPKDMTVGIVGMGNIGRLVVKQLRPFGFKFIYHNRRHLKDEDAEGAEYKEKLDDLLKEADVISVHVPLSTKSRHLFSTEQFQQMKKGSIIVNTARGPVIDEEALVQALKSEHLFAAGLDVFEEEPKVHPYLLEADNVILTPHCGGVSKGTMDAMEIELIHNIEGYLESGVPLNAVNKPVSK